MNSTLKNDNDDDDDDNDDDIDDGAETDSQIDADNDAVPLVHRSRAFLELSRDGDDDDDPSCFSDTWKAFASLLLAMVFLGPWIFSSYKSHHALQPGYVDTSTLLKVADSLVCSANLNISYSRLFRDVQQNVTGICRKQEWCTCQNPTIPNSRSGRSQGIWSKALERNVQIAEKAPKDLDIVFLGDSITERWLGTILASPVEYLSDIPALWNSTWNGHAIPLGLSGDRCNQLLYRLQHGEMPPSLNPLAWWILIGTNDSGADNCSRESILVGILAVALEVLRQKPLAQRIILQGLLPRERTRLDQNPFWDDFKWINARLQCFAKVSLKFEYYNGTLLFLTDDETEINQTLMLDYLHPSLEGYKLWSTDMIQKLKDWGLWSFH